MSTELFLDNRPFVLCIAGFDPSGGAGLLADIKTFEALGCYGLAVNTANTIQSDLKFKACHWTSEVIILQQLELILESFPVEVVKIGIIENLKVLSIVIDKIMEVNKAIKIIWDPVLKSSSGFTFHEPTGIREKLKPVLERIFLVTPNIEELNDLSAEPHLNKRIGEISHLTNLYLKGGHRTDKPGLDELFMKEGFPFRFKPGRTDCFEKHGSGCVLSSALAAHLALRLPLPSAAREAKNYIEKVLASNQTLLGYHNL